MRPHISGTLCWRSMVQPRVGTSSKARRCSVTLAQHCDFAGAALRHRLGSVSWCHSIASVHHHSLALSKCWASQCCFDAALLHRFGIFVDTALQHRIAASHCIAVAQRCGVALMQHFLGAAWQHHSMGAALQHRIGATSCRRCVAATH